MSTKYPESQKLLQNEEKCLALVDFLEYMVNQRGIRLKFPTGESTGLKDLVYDYLGFDTKKLKEEHNNVLKDLQGG